MDTKDCTSLQDAGTTSTGEALKALVKELLWEKSTLLTAACQGSQEEDPKHGESLLRSSDGSTYAGLVRWLGHQ